MKLTPPKRASTNGAVRAGEATQQHFSITDENPRIGSVAAR
jgi:hypothetical protein